MKNKFFKRITAIITTLTLSLSILLILPVTAAASEREEDVTDEEIEIYDGTISIEAPDIINNVDAFDVYGTISYKGGEVTNKHHIFLEIVNKDPDKPYIYEIQLAVETVNGEYRFSSIRIPSGYADDTYLINVYLWDDDLDKLLALNEKEVILINQ